MPNHRPAIVTVSLGRAHIHDFREKVEQAAKHGFQGIEVFYEDLEVLARQLAQSNDAPSARQLLEAARFAGELLRKHSLSIISLQPFSFYEGLIDRAEHRKLIEKIKLWFRLIKALGTTTIQIPANFLPADKITGDLDVIVGDLIELADLGSREEPVVRFAYENLCWSTYIDTWEKAWDIVKRVDRANFGICLDTFNIAGRIWGDPTSPTGTILDADKILRESMERLVAEVDVQKVFYIQVVDAERMDTPLVQGHPYYVEDQPPRMSWSRNARTFLYEEARGAYLPAEAVARVLIEQLGFQGFVSMELFSRTLAEVGDHVPEEHAHRGMESWKKLQRRLQLD